MDQTQKKLLKTSSKGSWYKQDISNEKHQEDKVGTPSSRKIQLPEMKSEDIPAGRIIIEMRILNEYLENVACCKLCKLGRVSLKSDQTKRMGLSNNLIWECDNLNCSLKTEMNTSKLCTDSKVPEINRALVLGMRTLGKGREAAAKLCAALDLPAPVSKPSYSNHIKKIESLTKPVLDMELANAAERVRTYKIENEDHSDSEMIECGVTVDGTWLNRGVSSRHGFVSVISVDTGEVLDYHYMCSVCPDCETWEDKTSQEYLELFVEHEPKCKLNYEGSSQNMETEGASILFGRSAEKHNLRYNPFIGDGDSKAYNRVLREKPYGPDFQIKKEECIGHIQKRMGTRLRNLINKMKGKNFYYFTRKDSFRWSVFFCLNLLLNNK